MHRPTLARLPLVRLALVVSIVVAAAAAIQAADGTARRSEAAAEVLVWTMGLGEILLALLIVAAMIRHERRSRNRSAD